MNAKLLTVAVFCLSLAACAPAAGTDGGSDASASSASSSAPAQYVSSDCRLSGCGGTVCIGVDDEDVVTTCEWKPAYACYASARCEKQASGVCDWTMTQELSSCLLNPPAQDSSISA